MFMENEDAQSAYRAWQEKGQELHQKGHQGVEPTDEDIAEIEMLKATVMANPVAVDFADAEDHMNAIFRSNREDFAENAPRWCCSECG